MRNFSLICILFFSAFCLKAAADTVNLKDGTKIDGTITQQDDNQITITYQVSASITDTKTIQRADIASIDKPTEDDVAFEPLKNLKPDSWKTLSPDAYTTAIADLKGFLAKYPKSAHAADAQASLDAFQAEQKHLQDGDVKLYGHWISKKEALARDQQIQAQALYLKMQDSAQQGDLIGALNTFAELEKSYSDSRVFPVAVEQATRIQAALQADVARSSENLKVTEEQWKQGVAITREPAKSEMIAARQAELAQYDAILASGKSGAKWPPFVPQSQKILDAIAAQLTAENARLAALPVEKMNASIAESDKAREAISTSDFATADSLLKDARTLWPKNEEADYLQKTLVALREAALHPPKPVTTGTGQGVKTTGGVAVASTPKPQATPVATPAPEPEEKPSMIDFFFTIPGALTLVLCAVGLIAIVSFLQRSKKDGAGEEQ